MEKFIDRVKKLLDKLSDDSSDKKSNSNQSISPPSNIKNSNTVSSIHKEQSQRSANSHPSNIGAGKKIDWMDIQPLRPNRKKPTVISKTSRKESKIEWAGYNETTSPDYSILIGIEDAFDHTPIQSGERVAFCKRDKVAYHFSTWQFLKAQNQGKCCICGLSNFIEIVTVPGALSEKDSYIQPRTSGVFVSKGEKIISLADVPDHVGRMVIVQDFVHEVYQTKNTGTYFVRFEPRTRYDPPFAGFKVVIFPDYQLSWVDQKLPIDTYEGKTIRVRGVVQTHPTWGIEILVNTPNVIEIVDN